MAKLKYIVLYTLLVLNLWGISQNNTGLIPIQTFNSDDLGVQPFCFTFAQDDRGVTFVGNKEGLLVYTGKWKNYYTRNADDIRSIVKGVNGKIYIGGNSEFGYFMPNDTGLYSFYSLDTLLPKKYQKDISSIQEILFVDSNTYFCDKNFIHKFTNDKYTKTIVADEEIFDLSLIHGEIIVTIKKTGLAKLMNDKLELFKNNKRFLYKKDGELKLNICPVQSFGKSKIIYVTKENHKRKIMTYDLITGRRSIIKSQIDSIINLNTPVRLLSINNKYVIISLENNGIIMIDSKGKFIRKIDATVGLLNNGVEGMFLDNRNRLWLAHRNGISRIDIFSSYDYMPIKQFIGVETEIEDISYFNDTMYFAAQKQLYYYNNNNFSNKPILTKKDIELIKHPKCSAVKSKKALDKGCWDLLKLKIGDYESMLFVTNFEVLELKKDGSIDTVYSKSASKLYQDPIDPQRVWVGIYPKGLTSIYFENNKWIDEGKLEGFNSSIYSIQKDYENNLWLGVSGAIKITNPIFNNHKIQTTSIEKFDTTNGLPPNDAIIVYEYNDEVYFASAEGIYEFDDSKKHFFKTDKFGKWFKSHHVHRIMADNNKKLWTCTYPTDHSSIFIKSLTPNSEDSFIVDVAYAKEITAQKFHSFYQAGNQLIAAGSFNIIHFNNITTSDTFNKVISFINRIELSDKKPLFGGVYLDLQNNILHKQSEETIPILDYKNNNLTFHFSAISDKVEGDCDYRWFLEGNDEKWEEWTDKTEVRFTNLHEGDYVFWMQAKDIYGNKSEKIKYAFTIDPPWHRTVWAYILYFLFFVAFVWGAVQYSTRSLKRIIKEATAEIQEQKDDIEEKNKDILSSIRYAQRIQEAVVPQKRQMERVFPNHFVLWKPRDIVSGDYYWMMEKGKKVILAAADCTGHGVPGAFMSIMGISFLNEIANNKEVQTAASALDMLRQNVITSLNQEGSETDTKDGMDMSLCVYDFDTMRMQFAGAYNPMYMIRDGELSVIKADRMPIGIHERDKTPFTNMEFTMHKGDIYYILSDGYIDQFGGPKGKKFMTKRFKKLLLEIYNKPMADQREILWQTLLEWRGDIEQLDDIIVIGVKV